MPTLTQTGSYIVQVRAIHGLQYQHRVYGAGVNPCDDPNIVAICCGPFNTGEDAWAFWWGFGHPAGNQLSTPSGKVPIGPLISTVPATVTNWNAANPIAVPVQVATTAPTTVAPIIV